MSEKTLKTRIQNKRGTTAEWATGTAPNFVPKDGEIVAYTDVHRVKIGDGTTKVSDLPFVDKVRDVTLDGESIVNADGVVELHPTAMTDGYVPVWNNTTKVFEDGIKKTNIVTLDTDQSIGGHKTFDTGFTTTARAIFNSSAEFNEDLTLACPIMISNSAGTTGQVLTSQGPGNSPKWGDVPAPTNVVTTNTSQTISGSKTFSAVTTYTGGITNKRSSTGRFFDCYSSANGATASTIFGVYLNNAGTSSANPIGTVNIGSASTQCAIELAGSMGKSGQVIISQGNYKTPKWGDVVTIDTTQTITGEKTFSSPVTTNSNLNVYATMNIDNGNDGIAFYNSNSSLSVTLQLDESYAPEQAATVRLPAIESSSASTVLLVSSSGTGTKGQVLTSDGGGNAATWSTLPEFAMNTALPISYRLSSSSNGYYSSVSYGTASTVNCLMTRDLPDHTSLNRHISYCVHLATTIAAGKWVRFDVPSISYNNTTYYPYIKTITATSIKTSTSSASPAIITYITNNQSSGGYAYVGCCSQQLNGLDVRIDCIVS